MWGILGSVFAGGGMADDYAEEMDEVHPCYCGDCRVLTEALQDIEQQCREAEDERFQDFSASLTLNVDELTRQEDAYLAKLSKLQHRRNCALEVLLKHQSLEHKS
jgi:hypothetical protein